MAARSLKNSLLAYLMLTGEQQVVGWCVRQFVEATNMTDRQAALVALGWALKLALEDLFGTAGPIDTYKMSGKTDARIVTDLLTTARLGNPTGDLPASGGTR